MSGGRMRRVDEAVREVFSGAITQELKDPRVGFVTVTAVKTSPDLRHARVFVTVLGDDAAARALAGRRCAPRTASSSGGRHRADAQAHADARLPLRRLRRPLAADPGAARRAGGARVSGSNGAVAVARADARRAAGRRQRFLLATHENPDGDALGSLAGDAARAGRARQGRRRLHGAGRVPAALRVPLLPGREPGHRAARRPRASARSSSSTAATSTATRPTRSSARARTSSTSTTTTTTRTSGRSTTWCRRRRARPRSSGT